MKFKILFVSLMCMFFSSCSNVELAENESSYNDIYVETLSKQTFFDKDLATIDFMHSVDKLNYKYSSIMTLDLGKWARRICSGAVDASIGAVAAPITFGAGVLASFVASALYDEYLDYLLVKNGLNQEHVFIPNSSQLLNDSEMKGVEINLERNTVYFENVSLSPSVVDSVGGLHNLLLSKLKKNGKKYIASNGVMDYDGLFSDAQRLYLLTTAGKEVILPDSITQENMRNNTPESIHEAIRSFTKLFIVRMNPIEEDFDFADSFEMARLNSIDKLNVDRDTFDDVRELGQKMMGIVPNLSDKDFILYCKDLNDLINESHLDTNKKNQFKTFNNIFVNSNLYWKQKANDLK